MRDRRNRIGTIVAAMPIMLSSPALADASRERLEAHVAMLAGQIGERNTRHPAALRAAAAYIRDTWTRQGYPVAEQSYEFDGQRWVNLEIERRGTHHPQQILLTGAHYDSVFGSPGANDNASGVAALLELSRLVARHEPARTLRFVAFVNEEPPHFYTSQMGSRVYAAAARARGDDIRAMFSLETIGYYSTRPGSQSYPWPFGYFYPDRGDFLGFVSNLRSRALLRRSVAAFRAASDFPVEHLATFEWVPGVNWSDHHSFWREGYPAIMVTDTAFYRYPGYHSALDTSDRLDYPGLKRVVDGLYGMLRALADSAVLP